MCKLCDDNNIGPDLGHGGFIKTDIDATWLSVDPQTGIRIAQKRETTYIGPKGSEVREETESIYVGWNDIHDMILTLIAADAAHNILKDEEDDNSGN